MSGSAWRPVSRKEPCSVCDKPNWCCRSADGHWSLCRRVDTGDGLHRIDKSGCDYWLYARDGAKLDRQALELPRAGTPQRANADLLHRAYQALLGSLTLSRAHRDNLRRRGLPDDEIDHRGYRSHPVSGRGQVARRLIEHFGVEVCSRVPGISVRTQDGRRWWSLAGAAGLLVPIRGMDGRITAMMVRRDGADADLKYSFISSARHGGPEPLVGVHVPLHGWDPGGTVRLTEGALKSDVTTCLDGTLTLGLSADVASWRQSLPMFLAMKVKTVMVAFDSDAGHNAHVARALSQAVRSLQASGFRVALEVWDEEFKGLDDLLAAGHRPEVLEGPAMREWIRTAMRSAARVTPTQIQQHAQRAPTINDHAVSSITSFPASDPWDGLITVPLRPYSGYRGARSRTGVKRG
jgi:Domain of unknown function (DUF3854)